jgi:hypothetical protein
MVDKSLQVAPSVLMDIFLGIFETDVLPFDPWFFQGLQKKLTL